MTEFSEEPIVGAEAAKHRRMRHEWDEFQSSERPVLRRLTWALKNWKIIAFTFVLGAAGAFKNVLDTVKGLL